MRVSIEGRAPSHGALGSGADQTHPLLIVVFGVALVFAVPVVWGVLRRGVGLPMFGAPTVADLETAAPDVRNGADPSKTVT